MTRVRSRSKLICVPLPNAGVRPASSEIRFLVADGRASIVPYIDRPLSWRAG